MKGWKINGLIGDFNPHKLAPLGQGKLIKAVYSKYGTDRALRAVSAWL